MRSPDLADTFLLTFACAERVRSSDAAGTQQDRETGVRTVSSSMSGTIRSHSRW